LGRGVAGAGLGAGLGMITGGSALTSTIGSAIGAAIGSFVAPGIGTYIGGAAGGLLASGGEHLYNNYKNPSVSDNGESVSNVEYGSSESTMDAKKSISEELKPLITELSAAIRNIPSSIMLTGNVEIDGRKVGKVAMNEMARFKRNNMGLTADSVNFG
jgi:hypothetical protein